jgi:hypothetical protein
MTEGTTTPVKKTPRSKKATTSAAIADSQTFQPTLSPAKSKIDSFNDLLLEINKLKAQFEDLQKEMGETQQAWVKEQRSHQVELEERDKQQELQRKREQELYQYEANLARKKAEDEFNDRKFRWEREFQGRIEEIEKDKNELEELRKLVAGFEEKQEKAVKEAEDNLRRGLESQFNTEKKLNDQETKAEKDLLNMRITNLTAENNRQAQEILSLRKALDEASAQVKEIAVKVIESGSNSVKMSSLEQ